MAKPTLHLGYLVPEFPGQTHIFFWREIQEIEKLGVRVDLVSTRMPQNRLMSHTWSQEAIQRTTYILPAWQTALTSLATAAFRQRLSALPSFLSAAWRQAEPPSASNSCSILAASLLGYRLAELARQRGWDHIHTHSCGNSATITTAAHRLTGIPYSLTLHGFMRDYGPNQPLKWRDAKFGLVITQQLFEETKSLLGAACPKRLAIAPMGVDLDRFKRSQRYQAWSGSGPLLIFSCARLNYAKGHADLIRSIGALAQRGVDAHLAIAGEDDDGGNGYRRDLERLIQELGLAGRVTLLGAVSEAVVHANLEKCHIFALASLAEPLGVAIMEAMAMEVPVVVTRAGGVPELVDHDQDGVMTPPSDVGALQEALFRVAGMPDIARELGVRARRKITEKFSARRSATTLVDMILNTPDGQLERADTPIVSTSNACRT